ncbi:MAG: hypothetical protein ACP5SH_22870 [Syntrophobacteraceae bacterium]
MEVNEVDSSPKIADAGAGGWIAYSIATWMAWALLVGLVNQKATLFMACISLACTIPYLGAAITQLKLGNLVGGVTWLYFGSFFAFCSALNYFVSYFAPIYGWSLDTRVLGFEWAVLGVMLVATTPVFLKYTPAAASISVIGADVGIAFLALVYWGIGGGAVAQISGWGFFVAGLFGMIMAVGSLLSGAGMRFPMGKPILS